MPKEKEKLSKAAEEALIKAGKANLEELREAKGKDMKIALGD